MNNRTKDLLHHWLFQLLANSVLTYACAGNRANKILLGTPETVEEIHCIANANAMYFYLLKTVTKNIRCSVYFGFQLPEKRNIYSITTIKHTCKTDFQ